MPDRKKTKLLVTVEVVADGDVALLTKTLKEQSDEQFPFINGWSGGVDGSYDVRCLGVRHVRKLK